MTDVTDIIREMASAPRTGGQERGRQLARALGTELAARVVWDECAGEDWAQVVNDKGVRAIVGMRWPIVIVLDRDLPRLRALIPGGTACIAVTDMEEPELSASKESLIEAFGDRAGSISLSAPEFSAIDLWFATV